MQKLTSAEVALQVEVDLAGTAHKMADAEYAAALQTGSASLATVAFLKRQDAFARFDTAMKAVEARANEIKAEIAAKKAAVE